MSTTLSPVAGFIPALAGNAAPGELTTQERRYLRDLAAKVAEVAANPEQERKRHLWYKHNRLEKVKPLLLVFPEDSWIHIIGENRLSIKNPFWRQWEWYLKHLIYRSEEICDDYVVEPDLYVNSVINLGGWGFEATFRRISQDGSYIWDAPLKELNDINKLTYPSVEIDDQTTSLRFEAVGEIFGDILNVRKYCGARVDTNIVGQVAYLRGIEQVMLDIYDEPEWLHELVNFITEGTLNILKQLESAGQLSLNNKNHYTDSGGIGYSTELPAEGFDSKRVRLRDMWGFGVAQEFSEVSPQHHEEFLLNYQMRILKNYGLVSYGCCEPLTHKFDMLINKIPNLRRVSVSPWCNTEIAAEKLKDKYIYSWKPNPAFVAQEFNPDQIRAYIRKALEVTKGCVVEIILKDLFTIQGEPERVEKWTRIAREEIERMH